MNKVFLALGIHNHQPVGNFDFVFEDSYKKAYSPFLEILKRHPNVKLAMHYSGILLEWILRHHPDYVDRLKALVQKGQIEMLTGGYYEPILSAIPENDRLGQIEKLTAFIRKHTGGEPAGMWCAERVWEPHLPKTMHRAGVRYSILDDAHFKYAGFEEEELHGYFVTEELGETVSLFPINEKLRYAIPFKNPEATIGYLRGVAEDGTDRLVVFADDGEKFGVWPETFRYVYADGWLEAFLNALEANRDWIRLIHFSEALELFSPLGRVYIPTASYREMMHWTLRTVGFRNYEDFEHKLKAAGLYDTYHIFVRGGFWRNFLAKYRESNQMHKKMLSVSSKVWAAKKKMDPVQFQNALDDLWAGQCNCPYWHGVFGGLYLPHLRHANFSRLIRAEKSAEDAVHSDGKWIEIEERDFDGDGRNETTVGTNRFGMVFLPDGGCLIEWDDKKHFVNLLNVMNRREEGYHRKLREMYAAKQNSHADGVASIHDLVKAKEEGLDKILVDDAYPHAGFVDHFLEGSTTLEEFVRCRYVERGDFVNGPYVPKFKKTPDGAEIEFVRDGFVSIGDNRAPLRLRKRLFLRPVDSELSVLYEVESDFQLSEPLWFGVELAFAFTSPNDPECTYVINGKNPSNPFLNSTGSEEDVREFALSDRRQEFAVRVALDRPATMWRFPLETVSLSEAGFERVYQGSVVLVHWKILPKPGEPFRVRLVQAVEEA
jgi:hypothetical protein